MIKRDYRDVLYALSHIVCFVHNYSMEKLEPHEESWFHTIYTGLIELSKDHGAITYQKTDEGEWE